MQQEWFLLVSLPLLSCEDGERVPGRYRLLWHIDDWHRMRKSGCQVQHVKPRHGERLERAVAIKAKIAWWRMLMTLRGRTRSSRSPAPRSATAYCAP